MAGELGQSAAQASENPRTRCVLWCVGESPADLVASLAQRHVAVESHADAFAVAAAVLSKARDGAPLIMLAVRPGELDRAEEVVRTIERFVPHVVCWRYDPGANPTLRGFVPPPPGPKAADPAPVRQAGARPKLRLAGDEGGAPPANTATPGGVGTEPRSEAGRIDAAEPELLSEEELAMLLSDEPPDAAQRPGRGGSSGT